ncbi:S-formylglutathione hydrolase [Malassezia vespertilionis]|uniref:S-formylglutathione hydrolase n=1 Tax=Malassezia vespertilionis TaxID=2020962 RepID=A0A2N1J7B6_9BASI|nr:S-formylglutathione hydrolase [Malassezia vespertilionis]PKI82441.1 hypothetical protein MVES_003624 [Malassezia vespertilionis]WFD08014.1 S-formylglutathione hydrolase [Malassezia vespertilionis]
MQQVSRNKTFGGDIIKYEFVSKSLGGLTTQMNVFIPPNASDSAKVPVLYYLAGLSSTEDNGAQKGNFFASAAQEGIAIVFPDTSPRGANIPGEDDAYDFGTSAGFYLNSTKAPWSEHYRMFDLVTKEIPEVLVTSSLPIDVKRASIMGHSMGGHGALVSYLKTAEGTYRSASAFAPISHPTQSPWGTKAFDGYLSGGVEEGKAWDASLLLAKRSAKATHIYVDCGTADQFYQSGQIQPERLVEAAKEAGVQDSVLLNMREGYDHSYFFVSTFGADHVRWHAKFLQ